MLATSGFRYLTCSAYTAGMEEFVIVWICDEMVEEVGLVYNMRRRRRADVAEEMVRNNLKNVPSKVSFTFDAWTSAPGDPYLSLTAHYIDAPPDHPNAWELKCDQLIFQEIEGRHTGKNMGEVLGRALSRYDLHGKVHPSTNFLFGKY